MSDVSLAAFRAALAAAQPPLPVEVFEEASGYRVRAELGVESRDTRVVHVWRVSLPTGVVIHQSWRAYSYHSNWLPVLGVDGLVAAITRALARQ